jgi:hypothetical protein
MHIAKKSKGKYNSTETNTSGGDREWERKRKVMAANPRVTFYHRKKGKILIKQTRHPGPEGGGSICIRINRV